MTLAIILNVTGEPQPKLPYDGYEDTYV